MAAIQTEPKPWCPECGAQMILKVPRKGQDWEPFWGCQRFPDCHGSRDIDTEGRPIYPEEDAL